MSFAERFLRDPVLFPGPGQSNCWGAYTTVITLAGGPYRVTGISQSQQAYLVDRFGPICSVESRAHSVNIAVQKADPEGFLTFDFTGQEYTFDLEYQPESILLAGRNFMGRLTLSDPVSASLWIPGEEFLKADSIFENFFRTLVAYNLLLQGGVLLHSGAVAREDEAIVFFGRSNAGKSTMSRMGLDAGFEVLSDDMNALLSANGGYRVEKLPFAGDLGQTATAKGHYPVRGLYWLEKSDTNRVVDMTPAQAISRMMACAAFVNGDSLRAAQLTDNLERLVQAVPVRELHFNTDGSVWDLL